MEPVFSCRDILKILPHRFPFLLVDKVVSWEAGPSTQSRTGQKVVAIKNVTFNEPFFPGHFPGLPVMPGVLQLEAMAQAACLAYYRKGDPEMDFFIASGNEVKFRRPVVPGDTLELRAEIVKDRGQMIVIKSQARVDGNVVSEAEILAKVTLKNQRDQSRHEKA
ncbi:MAG TPA: 3-hydroxyacyl-ACP dehydratase FabZ [Bdellovibrionales bacterium]|nr:3-hydroxyacyl-ACP dehydratase FabZ [Bdellovibrionales bacterium]